MAHVNNFSNNSTNGLASVQWNLLGGNGSARARWANAGTSQAYVFDPLKVKNPLLEPYLGAGVTEAQLARLLELSKDYYQALLKSSVPDTASCRVVSRRYPPRITNGVNGARTRNLCRDRAAL